MPQELLLPAIEFEPSTTLASGQVFRWRPTDHDQKQWLGIVSKSIIKLSKERATIFSETESKEDFEFLLSYLSASEDLETIFSSFPADSVLQQSRKRLRGLRLLTQDPWECLISFICSINCNIPSIRNKIENISCRFGSKISTDLDLLAYSFPTPKSLARASKKELLACNLGFRWRFVKFIAEQVDSGKLDLGEISKLEYTRALQELLSNASRKTLGVGPKVADCALLYSMHKTEAFPIDVWILRCLKQYYSNNLALPNAHLSQKAYCQISESMRKRFGKYCGYAQLYLYVMIRSSSRYSM